MKKIIGIVVVLLVAGFAGCKKENNLGKGWEATIDGQKVIGSVYGGYYSNSTTKEFSYSLRENSNDYGQWISFNLHKDFSEAITVDTYSIGSVFSYNACYKRNGVICNYHAQNGSIIITKFDLSAKRISGTFFFTAVNDTNSGDVVHITDGSFNNLSFNVN